MYLVEVCRDDVCLCLFNLENDLYFYLVQYKGGGGGARETEDMSTATMVSFPI